MPHNTLPTVLPRAATEADVPELVRVINAAYAVERTFVDGDRTNAGDVDMRMTMPASRFQVVDNADAPGGLLACVFVQIRGARGYFGMLAVDPAWQGRGLARALIRHVEDSCRAAGCSFLDIDVVNLRTELPGFYARFGFAPFGTGPFPTRERLLQPAHLVMMTKPLVPLWEGITRHRQV